MEKVSILVIGGRSVANFYRIWADPPDVVVLVASESSSSECALVKRVLSERQPQIVVRDPIYRPGNDLTGTKDACLAVSRNYPGAAFRVDVTSGSKLMSFGAYQAAQEMKCPALFVDTAHNQVIHLVEGRAETLSVSISVEDYLAFWGRKIHNRYDPASLSCDPSQASDAALVIAGNPVARRAIQRIRKAVQNAPKGWPLHVQYTKETAVASREIELLHELEQRRLIGAVHSDDPASVSFSLRRGGDWQFLDGTWLELYLRDEALKQKDGGIRFFDSVEFNSTIPQDAAEREFDMGCTRNGRFLLCSCKTGANWMSKAHLDELAAVRRLVGQDYVAAMYVTNALPPDPVSKRLRADYLQFLNHARQQRLVVVTGEELPVIGETLRREMLSPTYPPR